MKCLGAEEERMERVWRLKKGSPFLTCSKNPFSKHQLETRSPCANAPWHTRESFPPPRKKSATEQDSHWIKWVSISAKADSLLVFQDAASSIYYA